MSPEVGRGKGLRKKKQNMKKQETHKLHSKTSVICNFPQYSLAAHGLKIKIYCLDRWEAERQGVYVGWVGTLMHIPFPFVYERHSLANHDGKISCLLASLWATAPLPASFPAVGTLETLQLPIWPLFSPVSSSATTQGCNCLLIFQRE